MRARRTSFCGIAAALILSAVLGIVPAAAKAPSGPPPQTAKATTFAGTPTVGALYPNATTNQHSCTASVLASPTGNVLITAAHCIQGTGKGYVFAPGSHGSVDPYGRWRVTGTYLDRKWLASQDQRHDYAFLTVAPRIIHGRRTEIQQVTGANRLVFGLRVGERVTVPGYPAGADNDPVTCTTQLYFDGIYPAFNCDPYVGGTSGSPWLVQTGKATDVVGVIGGLHQGGCFSWTSYSSPFRTRLRAAMLEALQAAITGRPGDVAPAAGGDGCSSLSL